MSQLVIRGRYNGPPGSANGGVAAGLIADALYSAALPRATPVQVSLRTPPPLDTALSLQETGPTAWTVTAADGTVVAEAAASADELVAVAPTSVEAALEASTRFDGLTEHPFPTCFVCGISRPDGDGLSLHAGSLDPDQPGRVAGVTRPQAHGLNPVALGWAMLDCPGAWSLELPGRRVVLARMTARILGDLDRDEQGVVVAECERWDGRKAYSRVSSYGADGRLLGTAAQLWIELR